MRRALGVVVLHVFGVGKDGQHHDRVSVGARVIQHRDGLDPAATVSSRASSRGKGRKAGGRTGEYRVFHPGREPWSAPRPRQRSLDWQTHLGLIPLQRAACLDELLPVLRVRNLEQRAANNHRGHLGRPSCSGFSVITLDILTRPLFVCSTLEMGHKQKEYQTSRVEESRSRHSISRQAVRLYTPSNQPASNLIQPEHTPKPYTLPAPRSQPHRRCTITHPEHTRLQRHGTARHAIPAMHPRRSTTSPHTPRHHSPGESQPEKGHVCVCGTSRGRRGYPPVLYHVVCCAPEITGMPQLHHSTVSAKVTDMLGLAR